VPLDDFALLVVSLVLYAPFIYKCLAPFINDNVPLRPALHIDLVNNKEPSTHFGKRVRRVLCTERNFGRGDLDILQVVSCQKLSDSPLHFTGMRLRADDNVPDH
jgi:hypothetical protein